jgi:aspartyl-tRNA(Asn)/glutamyl-tRNA(Gln) amidotransferase subunit A
VIRAAVDATAGLLGGLGADVVEVSIPEIGRTGLAMPALANESQAALLPLALAGPDRFANADIRARTLAAELALPADRRRAQAVAQDIRDAIEAALAFVDVLVLPTNTTAPFPIGAARWRVGSGERVALDLPGGQARVTTRLTMPFNLAGVPVVSIPARDLVDGLPVGVQLVGRRWEDHRLLDIASLLEAHGAAWRLPPAAGG